MYSLIWDLSNTCIEIACELTGSGESESIHRDGREQTAGIKYKDLGTKDAAEDPTGGRKNYWIPGLPDNSVRRCIVFLPIFQFEFSGGMHQR